MVERDVIAKRGMRWAAASALAAVGATFVYDRIRSSRGFDKAEAQQLAYGSSAGRGTPHAGPSRSSRRAGYETTDANVRKVAIVMVVSVALIAGGLSGMFLTFGSFQHSDQAVNATLTAQQRARVEPPLPHLQAAPYRDIDTVLLEQSRRLTTFGWNDPDHTTAHIPIERAMQQVVGRSIDATAEADAGGAPGSAQSFPDNPAFNALNPERKAPIIVPGEGRPMNIAPAFEPKKPSRKP